MSNIKVVVVRCGNEEYALPVEHVVSIEKLEDVTPIPHLPEFVVGLMKIRGELVPILDFEQILYNRKAPSNETVRVVVVQTNSINIGLLVLDATEILDLLESDLKQVGLSIRGRVRVDNPQNLLKAGMFANIAVRVGQRAALTVPESAVLAANGELFVFVEKAPGTYQKHLIKTGAKGGGRVEVLAGVEAGEPVVVQGGFTLKSELEKGAFQGCGSGHAH